MDDVDQLARQLSIPLEGLPLDRSAGSAAIESRNRRKKSSDISN